MTPFTPPDQVRQQMQNQIANQLGRPMGSGFTPADADYQKKMRDYLRMAQFPKMLFPSHASDNAVNIVAQQLANNTVLPKYRIRQRALPFGPNKWYAQIEETKDRWVLAPGTNCWTRQGVINKIRQLLYCEEFQN